MTTLQLIITIVQLLTCLFLILVILLQTGKKPGLSAAFGGSSDTYMTKNKGKTMDARLAKWTKWVSLAFAVLTMALSMIPGIE